MGIILLVLLLNTVPFLVAALVGGETYRFDGILLNPLDGHTYLAKMTQGFLGTWKFTLPYTAEPGQGAYLNLFYIFLGHVARLTHLSLPLVFNIARILSGYFLLTTLSRFFDVVIPETRPRRIAFALAALGGGMGWLLIPSGLFTADFWVAETYPFLSIYDNPHFPLGLALMLWLLTPIPVHSGDTPQKPTGRGFWYAIVSLALAVISPFGVVIVIVVLAGWLAVREMASLLKMKWTNFLQSPLLSRLLWVLVGGVPLLIYQFWAIRTDPVLSGWDAQNLTPTPPAWDVFVALSPALLFALLGWRRVARESPVLLLVIWSVLGLILIMIPFGLQRRFLMGLYIPLAGLAASGLESLVRGKPKRIKIATAVLFLLALPTNIVVLLAGQAGVQARDPLLFRTRDEARALEWLVSHTPDDSLVLSPPETGLLIPAFSGRRVIYGHPFETVNAKVERQAVLDFFATMTETQAHRFLSDRDVDYIFMGSRQRNAVEVPFTTGLQLVFTAGDVQIFAAEK